LEQSNFALFLANFLEKGRSSAKFKRPDGLFGFKPIKAVAGGQRQEDLIL
jgi:hypothetical protein